MLDDDVRLVSVAPRFGTDGSIMLSLQFVSKNGNGMIETINRMHADAQFRNPFPSTQTQLEAGAGFAFQLAVQYVPPPMSGGVRLSEAPQ